MGPAPAIMKSLESEMEQNRRRVLSVKSISVAVLTIVFVASGVMAAAAEQPAELTRLAIISGEGERAPGEELVVCMEVALYGAMGRLALKNLEHGDFSHAPQQAAGIKEIFGIWASTGAGGPEEPDFVELLVGTLRGLRDLREPDASAARGHFAAAFRAFENDPHEIIRAMALHGLVVIEPDGVEAVGELLRSLRDDVRLIDYHSDDLCKISLGAVRLLEERGRHEVAADYCEGLMVPILKEVDPWLLYRWLPLARKWGRLVEKVKGPKEADAVYDRVLASLRTKVNWFPDKAGYFKKKIRTVEAWKEKVVSRPSPRRSESGENDADNPWNRYTMTTLDLDLSGRPCSAVGRGDRLYCFTLDYGRECRLAVSVHRFPAGGSAVRTARLSLDRSTEDCLSPAFIGNTLYIGTTSGLVVVPQEGKPKLLTEKDGLPGTTIWATTAYEGKLYLGLGGEAKKSGFGVYNPADGTGHVIFSSTAVEPDRRIKMHVTRIFHDRSRDCLWLVGSGLRRYDPKTEKLHTPVETRRMSIDWMHPNSVVFCHDGFLWSRTGVHFIDLETQQEEVLVAPPFVRGKPLYGSLLDYSPGHAFYIPSPVSYDGTRLITFTRGKRGPVLCMRRRGKKPALKEVPNFYYQGICQIYRTRHGLLALSRRGEGYLIRRTGGKPASQGRDIRRHRVATATLSRATSTYNRTENHEKAMDLWKKVFTQYPHDPAAEKALFYYGITGMEQGKYAEARRAFRLYLKRYPDSRWTGRIRDRELPRAEEKLQEPRASQ